jgi:hypothetical protein
MGNRPSSLVLPRQHDDFTAPQPSRAVPIAASRAYRSLGSFSGSSAQVEGLRVGLQCEVVARHGHLGVYQTSTAGRALCSRNMMCRLADTAGSLIVLQKSPIEQTLRQCGCRQTSGEGT